MDPPIQQLVTGHRQPRQAASLPEPADGICGSVLRRQVVLQPGQREALALDLSQQDPKVWNQIASVMTEDDVSRAEAKCTWY